MLALPEGPDSPQRSTVPWTRADVELWLKAAFRAMPFTPIYAPRGNILHAASSEVPDATFDMLAFSGTVLGDKSEDRQAVLVWARAMATKGEVGGSIAEFCRRTRWSRATFDRRRIKVCERIAAAKNVVRAQYEAR
ncbi:hypothetical protein OKC48_21845 [Methylorubrum extorquens]|uniref:hypothetical protein n=1 Tax=Methylorubrum extorquens TaxID=408 RepID=UPI0022388D68|nr:hypothetical protein [Methylorubrum extorquens]UYW25886.1 hypothetical protein OKC48_21845 [Methylorubrum extorquens]